MLTRRRGYLNVRAEAAPEASQQLEQEGWTVVRGALSAQEVAALTEEIEALYAALPPDGRHPHRPAEEDDDFRYEMLNRSALCQDVIGNRAILDAIEPLLGEDCHVIANTCWRNPPRERQYARRRRVAHRCRSAHSAPAGHSVGRSHSVSDLRDRRAHLPEGLPARVRPDGRDSAQPQIGPAAAGRSRVGCRTDVRWPRRGAAAREGGRRRDVRLRRVAPAAAAVAGRYRTLVPAGPLRAPRHRAADPQHEPGQSSVGRCAANARKTPRQRSLVGLHHNFFYDG